MAKIESIVVGQAILDVGRAELRDLDGSLLHLRPQSLKVLERLVAEAGRVVSREALMRDVWSDVVVTDDSLVQCIVEIRRAIGDERHELLRTVPRRGYRLDLPAVETAPVGGTTQSAASDRVVDAPRRGRRTPLVTLVLVALGALAVALVAPRAPDTATVAGAGDVLRPPLAVLAFRAEDGDAAAATLAAGLAEDLIGDLARDVDLRVISARSSFALDRQRVPATQIASQLGVRYLVDGKLTRDADRLGLLVQLIDGTDGHVVWTDASQLEVATLGSARKALLERIGGSVQASMRRNQKESVPARAPTSLDAYTLTLRAYGNKHRYTPGAYRSARADFEHALRLDPGYAAAWAGLGYLNAIDSLNRITGEWTLGRLPEALAQIDRALAIDATLSIVHQARAITQGAMQRFEPALASAAQAVRLAPGDPDNLVVLAMAQTEAGRPADGIGTMERALVLYPIEPPYVSFIHAHVLWANSRHEAAEAKATACIERTPKFVNCRITRASALFELGRIDEAHKEAQEIRALMPAATAIAFWNRFAGVPDLRERRLRIAQGLGFPDAR